MADVNPIQLQKFLGGIEYPASKQTLIDTAKEHGADDDVLEVLNGLPDQEYDAPTAVVKAQSKE